MVGIAFASKIDTFFKKSGEDLVNGTTNLTTTLMPESLYGNATTTLAPEHEGSESTYHQVIGSLFALGAMVVGSLVYIMVRKV